MLCPKLLAHSDANAGAWGHLSERFALDSKTPNHRRITPTPVCCTYCCSTDVDIIVVTPDQDLRIAVLAHEVLDLIQGVAG
jgi:hypothetical protein